MIGRLGQDPLAPGLHGLPRIADKEGERMLEQTAPGQNDVAQEGQKDKEVVTCYVCKQNVSRSQARQLVHPKDKRVWVCEEHIKQ